MADAEAKTQEEAQVETISPDDFGALLTKEFKPKSDQIGRAHV